MSLQQLIGLPPPQQYTSDDPFKQGFYDSEFFKPNAPSTMDVVNYTYQGNPMQGSSSGISQFKSYLDSIGKGDLLVNQNSGVMSQDLAKFQLQSATPNYSSQFEDFGKTLGGFGEQMTGYQDALGSFNEQIGGFGKQFETLNNKVDNIDQGLGSLGNQIASLENMQKAQPQGFMPQQQQQSYSPFNSPFGFGGLGSLFGGYF